LWAWVFHLPIESDADAGTLFTISPSGAAAGPLNAIDALLLVFIQLVQTAALAAQRFSRAQHIVYGTLEQRELA
jgi:hypothetical protein